MAEEDRIAGDVVADVEADRKPRGQWREKMARAQAMGLVFCDPSGGWTIADPGKLKAWFGAERDRPVAAKPDIRPLLLGIGEYLTPLPRPPRPECMTDWVPASLYGEVVAERDDSRARVYGLEIERGMILAQLAAKDARIAELKSELALRPAAFVEPEPEPAKPNPFREHKTDPRRMGPA